MARINKPSIHMPRSRFDLSYSYKTTMNLGDLIPFYVQEVYPGDTFKVNTSLVVRTSTPFIKPIMDNIFIDTFYFFVPNRLSYEKWSQVLGENTQSYWDPSSTPDVPVVYSRHNGTTYDVPTGSLADYFGIPANMNFGHEKAFNALPFRDYALIYNDWFRNENLQAPAYVNTGDFTNKTYIDNLPFSGSQIFGKPANINKLKDYFTACLLEPQKGDAIDIPVNGLAKLTTSTTDYLPEGTAQLKMFNIDSERGFNIGFGSSTNLTYSSGVVTESNGFSNLYANIADAMGNINDLRYAFALQRALEKDARGGTRYIEYLFNHFGVISPDARLQRPEFLGGKRIPLNVSQVAQTAPNTASGTTDTTSYLGEVGAFSLSNGFAGFNKGFVEHGFIIGLCAVRQKHSYQQGIDKFWTRKSRYDYYDPVFSFIGEQPVMKSEIFAAANDDEVWGYNEAYADLRFRPSKITGQMSSNSDTSFDIWHLADDYATKPTLGGAFAQETKTFVNRCLSATAPDNFIVDAFHNVSAVRVLPTFGIPGLVDHI